MHNPKGDQSFNKIDCRTINDNFIRLIGDDWLLITAGKMEEFNTMTASWGGIGVLWNKAVAICFIRPTRYTYMFTETNDIFTLSFFSEKERDILRYCGTKSGRDVNKIAATGLEPFICENSGIGYSEASLIFECRKIYYDDLKATNFLLPETDGKNYPKKDYHRMYIGEILASYQRKQSS